MRVSSQAEAIVRAASGDLAAADIAAQQQLRADFFAFSALRSGLHTAGGPSLAELGPMPTLARALDTVVALDNKHAESSLWAHRDERAALLRRYRERFGEWALWLANGFSLIMYGVGSKRDLQQEFARFLAGERTQLVMTVDGTLPVKLPELLRELARGLRLPGAPTAGRELLPWLLRRLSAEDAIEQATNSAPVVVLMVLYFDSIRTVWLRDNREPSLAHSLSFGLRRLFADMLRLQESFMQLCQTPRVRLVASLEHRNSAGTLGCNSVLAPLIFLSTPTYEQYAAEQRDERSLAIADSELSVAVFESVLQALPMVQQKVRAVVCVCSVERDHRGADALSLAMLTLAPPLETAVSPSWADATACRRCGVVIWSRSLAARVCAAR